LNLHALPVDRPSGASCMVSFPGLLPSLLHSSIDHPCIVLPTLQPLAIGDHSEVC
jgi:hypothetical protein